MASGKTTYTAVAAITVDGKIARDLAHMSDWTSKEDKEILRAAIAESDAVLVGNNTYKTAIAPLSKRNCVVITRSVSEPKRANPLCVYINPEKNDLRNFLEAECGYQSVCILGGAATYNYCLAHDMLDFLYLTIEPVVFGAGIDLFTDLPREVKFQLVDFRKLNPGGTIFLKYRKSAV